LNNRFWFKELKLGLGLWEGVYDLVNRYWLRWYDASGNWIPNLQIWEWAGVQIFRFGNGLDGWSLNLQIWEWGWPQRLKTAFPNLKIWTPADIDNGPSN
jgi:hypothetical protein